jgi:2-polyprenyl-3-methyl-5-hydroxy-6-metoxy-1,4-benzoquinol methylase
LETEIVTECNLCGCRDLAYVDKKNSIGQCGSCGFIFDMERPSAAEIERYYSREGKYNDWISKEQERDLLWRRRLEIVLKYRRQGTLLDVGTGTGQFLHFAKRHFKVSGTEISTSGIEIAHRKYGLTVMRGTLEDLVFDTKFDVITLYHVLEHVPNPSSTIRRCRALLNPGGFLFVAVPNDVSWIRASTARFLGKMRIPVIRGHGVMGLPKLVLDGSIPEIHMSHFTSPVLVDFLKRNQFKVVEDTLDRFYAESGGARLMNDVFYYIGMAAKILFGVNIYPTILVIARRNGPFLP